MLPFIVIVLILIGSVIGQILFGKTENTEQKGSADMGSRERYRSRKA